MINGHFSKRGLDPREEVFNGNEEERHAGIPGFRRN